MSKILNVGLVGFGLSGHKLISPFLHYDNRFNLKKVMQHSKSNASEVYPDVEVVNDYEALINDNAIDLVIITSPNEFHFEQARKALEKDKHVVIEKPITPTVEQADFLIELAGKKKKVMSVYHNRRWDGNFLTVKKIVKQGLLGRLVEYESHFDRYDPVVPDNSWRDEERPASGVLFDLGPHLIDQALQLFGYPDAVWADIRTERANSKVDDAFQLKLYYDGIAVTLKAGKMVREQGPAFILHGTQGSFIKYGIDPQEARLMKGASPFDQGFGNDDPENWGVLNTQIDGLHYYGKVETEAGNWHGFFNNIYKAVVEGESLDVEADDAKKTVAVIQKAFESIEKKKLSICKI